MKIHRLILHDYRNIASVSVDAHSGFNVIHGANAQGKTNLLEAIYILGTLKSFRPAKNAELIRWSCEEAAIRAVADRRDVIRDLRVNIRPSGKSVTIDDKRVRGIKDTFGHVHSVVFSPEDLAISKGSASMRRTFLDRAVFHYTPTHFEVARDYDRALRSRNALLKDIRSGRNNSDLLDVFDAQLVQHGSAILHTRLRFVESFRPHFIGAYSELCASASEVQIHYDCSIEGVEEGVSREDISAHVEEALKKSRDQDMNRGFTTSGPHVDDLLLCIDERPVRSHASQGQHRTLVLALKISEITFLQEVLGFRPILLLDDVSSELDRARNDQLMNFLRRESGQVFLTTTDPAHVAIDAEMAFHEIKNGSLIESRMSV